jgi:hypothetical protein
VDAQEADTDGVLQHLVADVRAGSGGEGGSGGSGGAGADGGTGGDSQTAAVDGGAGGDGAEGGAGADGGSGGSGGSTVAVRVADAVGSEHVVQTTIADVASGEGADAGVAGEGGAGGSGGSGGAGLAPEDGNDDGPGGGAGSGGDGGVDGLAGADGDSVGVLASEDTELAVRNTVIALDSAADGVALLAEDATIDSDFDFFDGVASVASGAVSLGAGDREEDPELIDPGAGDYRLGPDSPAIDAGDNGSVPAGILVDLDGEPRRVDDPPTPDTGAGVPPLVDVGAFEFQPPSCHTDPDVLWPPNHRYVDVSVLIDFGTAAGVFPYLSGVWASSDEPDNSNGDGNTTGDVNGSDGFTSPVDVTGAFHGNGDGRVGVVRLRSERRGPGDGREYGIDVEIDGDQMRPRTFRCAVVVPHDQGH